MRQQETRCRGSGGRQGQPPGWRQVDGIDLAEHQSEPLGLQALLDRPQDVGLLGGLDQDEPGGIESECCEPRGVGRSHLRTLCTAEAYQDRCVLVCRGCGDEAAHGQRECEVVGAGERGSPTHTRSGGGMRFDLVYRPDFEAAVSN